MRVSFDLDGVLYPWQIAVWEYCVRQGITRKSFEDFFIVKKETPQQKMFWYNIVRDPLLYETFVPGRDLMQFINRVAKKHVIYYITARPPEMERITAQYLKRYNFPFLDNLIMTRDKDIEIARHQVALHVDDSYEHADKVTKHCASYLVNKPYNRMYNDNPRIVRINHVFDLEGVLF
jgi:uncharacterized HAD superfamily protein